MMELLRAKPSVTCTTIHHRENSTQANSEHSVCSIQGAVLGCLPDGQAECNLVDEVCKVVDQVEAAVVDSAHKIAEEVTSRIDRPTCSDNQAHGAERRLHILVG